MLALHRSGRVRATPKGVRIAYGATLAVLVVFVVDVLLHAFTNYQLAIVDGNGPLAVLFTLGVIALGVSILAPWVVPDTPYTSTATAPAVLVLVPVPVKAMLRVLGLPAGECRLPLGPAPAGLEERAKKVSAALESRSPAPPHG